MMSQVVLLLLALFAVSPAVAYEETEHATVYFAGWDMVPLHRYDIDDIRERAVYRLDSGAFSFVESLKTSLSEDELLPCKVKFDEKRGIALVVDLTKRGQKTRTLISDSTHLFTQDLKRCRAIDESFKSRFRIFEFDF
jgi:hypothetical protein